MKIKLIKQEYLTIANGTIESSKSFIQIRNVTRVWYGRLEVDIPLARLVLSFLIGFALSTLPFLEEFSIFGTFIIIIALLQIAYYLYLKCFTTLNFEMASGEIYAFTARDEAFLKLCFEKVKNIIEKKESNDKPITMSFSDCEINVVEGNQTIIKDNKNAIINSKVKDSSINQINGDNFVNNGSINAETNNAKIDYVMLYKELEECAKELSKVDSDDATIIEAAMIDAKNENTTLLKEKLSKLKNATIQFISTSASLTTLAKFIMDFVSKK